MLIRHLGFNSTTHASLSASGRPSPPGYFPAERVRTMNRQDVMAATLQLQRDAGIMASKLQVLDQYVMSLNQMSSEVLHLAFGLEVFPVHAVNSRGPVPRVHHAATQMAAMGLWRPPIGPGCLWPITVSSSSDCSGCKDCYPGLPG